MTASPMFLDNLRRSGLFSEGKYAEIREQLSHASAAEPSSALVEQGLLTPFQAEKIRSGHVKGLVLGQYHLLEELGQGGFGRVYKAKHTIMNRLVALKIISPELVEDAKARKRFRREILALTNLIHPNIVMAHDANEVDDLLFLVMEYVEGPNLQELVKTRGPLGIGLACAMLHQACKGLQFAHEKGMVHRDIKPANLLIPREGLAALNNPLTNHNTPVLLKVADFGLALVPVANASQSLESREKNFVGTPDYVSPEQARYVTEVDIRSDLYSLGCTFYYALTGRKPFSGTHPLEIIVQHLEKEPTPLLSLRPEVPPAVNSILRKLMAKDPDKRFQTPMELISELTFLIGGDLRSAPVSFGITLSPGEEPQPLSEDDLPPTRNGLTSAHQRKSSPFLPLQPQQEGASFPTLYSLPALSRENTPAVDFPTATFHGDLPATEPPAEAPPAFPQPSTLPDQNTHLDRDFSLFWSEWVRVVETIGQGKIPRLEEKEYRSLHTKLLEIIRSQRQQAEPSRQTLLKKLENLLEPWFSLETLARTETEILVNLLGTAHSLEVALGLSKKSWQTLVMRIAFFLLLAMGALAGFFFLP